MTILQFSRRMRCRARPCATVALALLLAACAGGGTSPRVVDSPDLTRVVLRKADGVVVDVPRTGALADERALELARAISDFDTQSAAGGPLAKIADPGLREAVAAMATALRDDALDQLDLTYRVARRTSAGLDGGLLAQGQETMKKVTDLLSHPPTRLYVRTQITSQVVDVSLHYMSSSDYRRQSSDWMSYTIGQMMKIGAYVFRLQRQAGAGEPLLQRVEIMSDPFVRTLDPARRP